MMNELKAQGHNVVFATSPSSMTDFRNNSGQDLSRYAQSWAIDGVKAQLFCPHDVAYVQFPTYRAWRLKIQVQALKLQCCMRFLL